jgi:hypothetical protein
MRCTPVAVKRSHVLKWVYNADDFPVASAGNSPGKPVVTPAARLRFTGSTVQPQAHSRPWVRPRSHACSRSTSPTSLASWPAAALPVDGSNIRASERGDCRYVLDGEAGRKRRGVAHGVHLADGIRGMANYIVSTTAVAHSGSIAGGQSAAGFTTWAIGTRAKARNSPTT